MRKKVMNGRWRKKMSKRAGRGEGRTGRMAEKASQEGKERGRGRAGK
jgi:hypothetical protein